MPTARTSHLKFDEVSDGTCFFGFPSGLALRTPNGTEFVSIAFAKVGAYLKKGKQQHYDESAEEAEMRKGASVGMLLSS
jgi:hypothetical protein